MFCPNCGAQIEDDSLFCPECGTKIEAADPMTTPPPAAPEPPQYNVQPQYEAQPQYDAQAQIPMEESGRGMKIRTASLLCYWFSFIGWLIAYFASDNSNPYLRFHLNQSLYLWAIGLVLSMISDRFYSSFIGILAGLASFALFILWLIAFVGSCKGQTKSAPLLDKIPPILK